MGSLKTYTASDRSQALGMPAETVQVLAPEVGDALLEDKKAELKQKQAATRARARVFLFCFGFLFLLLLC